MSKYQFSPNERHAVFTVHGGKCYICTQKLDLCSMQVDHIIPESLIGKSELKGILGSYGLPLDFNLNSYSNWSPSCGRCNNQKKAIVIEPILLIKLHLQKAKDKAKKCLEAENKLVSNSAVSRSFNVISRAYEEGTLSQEQVIDRLPDEIQTAVRSLQGFQRDIEPLPQGEPLQLAPRFGVIYEDSQTRLVRGPYGVGAESKAGIKNRIPGCGVCGAQAFNGARCVHCGYMDDGD